MNDSTECTCDIRRTMQCTCGAMERERRAVSDEQLGEMANGEVVCHGCERNTTFAECEVVGMRLLCACCRQAGPSPDAIINAAAVNANVSPDVVRERAERVYGPEFLIVTKQQAAKMEAEHAELVARIEALEERDAARTTARGFILHPGADIEQACQFVATQVRKNLDRGQSVKIVVLPAD